MLREPYSGSQHTQRTPPHNTVRRFPPNSRNSQHQATSYLSLERDRTSLREGNTHVLLVSPPSPSCLCSLQTSDRPVLALRHATPLSESAPREARGQAHNTPEREQPSISYSVTVVIRLYLGRVDKGGTVEAPPGQDNGSTTRE